MDVLDCSPDQAHFDLALDGNKIPQQEGKVCWSGQVVIREDGSATMKTSAR